VSLIVAEKYLTVMLGSGSRLDDAPRPKDDDACGGRNNDIAPGRGKRLESRWHYRHLLVDCGWSEHERNEDASRSSQEHPAKLRLRVLPQQRFFHNTVKNRFTTQDQVTALANQGWIWRACEEDLP
jgi:hypothetical protein